MGVSAGSLAGRSLVTVFAHPDDESLACGGLLAWCAELGARVSVICVTRGELGRGGDERLGEVRTGELETAAAALGVSEVVVLDYQDGMLPWADATRLESDIRGLLCRVRPDVVITFDEDGLYWHPDHVAIHERTTAAVAALADEAPALFYVSMAEGQMAAVVEAAGKSVPAPAVPFTILGVSDPHAFGASALTPTLRVQTGAFALRKLAALRCHRSQLAGDALDLLSDDEAVRLLGTECFRRARVGSGLPAFIERFAAPEMLARSPAER